MVAAAGAFLSFVSFSSLTLYSFTQSSIQPPCDGVCDVYTQRHFVRINEGLKIFILPFARSSSSSFLFYILTFLYPFSTLT